MSGEYAPTTIDGKPHVWLQNIGFHPAKPLGDVKAGDVLVYNYGSTAVVVSTRRVGQKSVAMTVETEGGKRYDTTSRRAATLVAVKGV